MRAFRIRQEGRKPEEGPRVLFCSDRRHRSLNVRRPSVALEAITLAITILLGFWTLFPLGEASASPPHNLTRGSDRYATAVRVSQQGFSPGVEAVVLATGEDYPDTLPVGALAAVRGWPILVTPSRTYTVHVKSNKWDGSRYEPLYLDNILAIRGYPSVPPWPAGHGCIRVPLWDMDELFPPILVGTQVHVY